MYWGISAFFAALLLLFGSLTTTDHMPATHELLPPQKFIETVKSYSVDDLNNWINAQVMMPSEPRNKIWFAAPFTSSFIGSLIDTFLFFFIAFYGTNLNWISLGFGDFLMKVLMALIMLIPFRMLMSILKESSRSSGKISFI